MTYLSVIAAAGAAALVAASAQADTATGQSSGKRIDKSVTAATAATGATAGERVHRAPVAALPTK
jgi:hypothetical protein